NLRDAGEEVGRREINGLRGALAMLAFIHAAGFRRGYQLSAHAHDADELANGDVVPHETLEVIRTHVIVEDLPDERIDVDRMALGELFDDAVGGFRDGNG